MSKLRAGETSKNLLLVGTRDAFHVPAVLVYSAYDVKAGQDVVFTTVNLDAVQPCLSGVERHAIVDPFIKGNIKSGTVFNVFIEPSLVQNLLHHFELNVEVSQPTEYDEECEGCYGEEPELYSDNEYYDGCKGCYD